MQTRRGDHRALARLADELKPHRLRAAARSRLGEDLALLDRHAWHVERDVILNGVTMPYVIFGPTGVFAFSASHEWAFTDLGFLGRLSQDLAAMLPGYSDPVRAGIYLPSQESPPRSWFDGRGAGGWIIGRGQLLKFLQRFSDQGFSCSDLDALRTHLAAEAKRAPSLRLPSEPLNG